MKEKTTVPDSIYGIQGGKGSFNEEALLFFTQKHSLTQYRVHYLFTSDAVLKNLHNETIDYGLFAIKNTIGGLVEESTHALSKYPCIIVEEFTIPIRHFLMKRKDVEEKDITAIMAHPQVLKQCHQTLTKKYSHMTLTNGIGDMIDTAKAAQAVAEGNIPSTTAILGPFVLSTLYQFDIIGKNLQDHEENNTTFLLVKK